MTRRLSPQQKSDRLTSPSCDAIDSKDPPPLARILEAERSEPRVAVLKGRGRGAVEEGEAFEGDGGWLGELGGVRDTSSSVASSAWVGEDCVATATILKIWHNPQSTNVKRMMSVERLFKSSSLHRGSPWSRKGPPPRTSLTFCFSENSKRVRLLSL